VKKVGRVNQFKTLDLLIDSKEIKMQKITVLIALTIVLLLNSGCSSTPKPRDSGFLGNNIELTKSEQFDNSWVYVLPEFNQQRLAKVKKIQLVPFEIWLEQTALNNEKLKSINTTQLRKLHRYFHNKLTASLTAHYQIVDNADENTLIIKGAFTNIHLAEPELAVTDLIPIRLVLNAGKTAYLMATEQKDIISKVALEVEFIMGTSQQRVFAMAAEKNIDVTVTNDAEGNFSAVTQVLDIWVDNFAKKLTQIRNAHNASPNN